MWWLIPAAIGAVVAMDHDDRLNAIERRHRDLANASSRAGWKWGMLVKGDGLTGCTYRCPACRGYRSRQGDAMENAKKGDVFQCGRCQMSYKVIEVCCEDSDGWPTEADEFRLRVEILPNE